jgi:hypothetical protein
MPDLIQNVTTICGDPNTLNAIRDSLFDFNVLHPCEPEHEDDKQKWCYAVWGTPQPARDITFVRESPRHLRISYSTILNTPHGIFAYLTLQDLTLYIRTVWTREYIEAVGYANYERGIIKSKSFDPSDFKPSALKRFAHENPWFSYTSYADIAYDDEREAEVDETREYTVVVNEWEKDYQCWLDNPI